MNTPAHTVVNLLLLGKRDRPKLFVPILLGSILPDLPMMVFYAILKLIQGVPEETIWQVAYFKPGWQAFFDSVNSIPLLGVGLMASLYFRVPWSTALFASMLLHTFGDLPLHFDDAHRHFFPLSAWRFFSPVSYWDPARFGVWMSLLEMAVVLVGSVALLRRFALRWVRVLVVTVSLTYLSYWGYVFWVWL